MRILSAAFLLSAACALTACKNSETAKGDLNVDKGNVEHAVGSAVGSDSLQAAGSADKAKGNVQKGVGSVEHAVNP
jgi:uncharacterized protein YjbJ (UPF0337 family)